MLREAYIYLKAHTCIKGDRNICSLLPLVNEKYFQSGCYGTREGTCEFYFLTSSDDLICCSNDLISCLHNLSSCSNDIIKLL